MIVLGVVRSRAADLRVPADFSSIRKAVSAAKDGDTVLVAPGMYTENSIDLGHKSIVIKSLKGPAVTVVQSDEADRHIFVVDGNQGPRTRIQGLTIKNGHARDGGGIYIDGSSPTIIGNFFDANRLGGGGSGAAIVVMGNSGGVTAAPLIANNTFRNNQCDGQFTSGVVTGWNNASPRIYNNLFENNPCAAVTMALSIFADADIANNTMVHNYAGVQVFAVADTYRQVYRNNIITGNNIGTLVIDSGGFHDPTWRNNLVYGNDTNYEGIPNQATLNGNLSAPVSFVNPGLGDFRLNADSPAIDAGTDSPSDFPVTDMDGRTRVLDGDMDGSAIIDMGAFEFRAPVGGMVTGGGQLQVVCQNQRTNRRVTLEAGDSSEWNCEAAGLLVHAGDKVAVWAVGEAVGSEDATGYAQGMTTRRAKCTTLETGRHVTLDLHGATSWSCREMGLTLKQGDRIRVWVQGAAY